MGTNTLPTFIFTINLSILLLCTASNNPIQGSEPDCTNRRIYIRKLPTKFNLDLLTNCSSYFPLYENFCPFLANHGLGQKTHNRTNSWYRSDPNMLELVFHRRMLEYPCLTPDPVSADAIFLPYYGGIDALRYLYGSEQNFSALHGRDLYEFLQEDEKWIWERRLGKDHFLVMARSAWDFSQRVDVDPPIWGTSFLELQEFYNVTALTIESRAWPWQEQAIPHPTSFHPPNLVLMDAWVMRVRNSWRRTLMLFAGGGGTSSSPNIRRSIREECVNENSTAANYTGPYRKICDMVDCSKGICEHDPIRFMRPMLRATFCLQPPGDTPTRRSTFDSILAGCIPVFFEDNTARNQYQWHLPPSEFDEFSVSISKEDVVYKGLKISDVLMAIPEEKVMRIREKVIELIPKVTYRKHGSSLGLRDKKDAFDIAIDGTLQRIQSRMSEEL